MTGYRFAPTDAPDRPDVYDAALKLLVALSDPKQSKINLERHAANAKREAELDEREEALERRETIVAAKLESLDEDVAKRRAAADKRIADERKAFDESVAGRLKDLEQRAKAVEEARERNIKLHDDLERRISIMRSASV